ncbi:MAG: hypothetical protein K6C69_07900 [Lachnospiraceae bacterium]|nr:hypothetical protein [Lachnospiraceae bacterium]
MKKNTINIIILVLCLINLILNALIIFSVLPMANKTSSLVTKIAGIIDLELDGKWAGSGAPGTLTIDQIDTRIIKDADENTKLTVSVTSADGKSHYVVTGLAVSLDMTHKDYATLSASFDNANSLVISKAEQIIASYTFEEASSKRTEMQERILQALKELFQSDMIYEVSFQGFLVQ